MHFYFKIQLIPPLLGNITTSGVVPQATTSGASPSSPLSPPRKKNYISNESDKKSATVAVLKQALEDPATRPHLASVLRGILLEKLQTIEQILKSTWNNDLTKAPFITLTKEEKQSLDLEIENDYNLSTLSVLSTSLSLVPPTSSPQECQVSNQTVPSHADVGVVTCDLTTPLTVTCDVTTPVIVSGEHEKEAITSTEIDSSQSENALKRRKIEFEEKETVTEKSMDMDEPKVNLTSMEGEASKGAGDGSAVQGSDHLLLSSSSSAGVDGGRDLAGTKNFEMRNEDEGSDDLGVLSDDYEETERSSGTPVAMESSDSRLAEVQTLNHSSSSSNNNHADNVGPLKRDRNATRKNMVPRALKGREEGRVEEDEVKRLRARLYRMERELEKMKEQSLGLRDSEDQYLLNGEDSGHDGDRDDLLMHEEHHGYFSAI